MIVGLELGKTLKTEMIVHFGNVTKGTAPAGLAVAEEVIVLFRNAPSIQTRVLLLTWRRLDFDANRWCECIIPVPVAIVATGALALGTLGPNQLVIFVAQPNAALAVF